MEMIFSIITACIAVVLLGCLWRVLDWVWFTPKRLERILKREGFNGNEYRILRGDTKEMFKMQTEARLKPMDVSSDYVAPRFTPYLVHLINKYGKKCYVWSGPNPTVFITDPELIKEVFNRFYDFPKQKAGPAMKKLFLGLITYDKDKWEKHRKLMNPAFYMEKLKLMQPAFLLSCSEMLSKWEKIVLEKGSCELDVWPHLQVLTCGVIARAAFGSNYEEGKRIFDLQREQLKNLIEIGMFNLIPGWRFVPTKLNRRIDYIYKEVKSSMEDMIEKRMKAMKAGEKTKDDLLGLMLESNLQEIKQQGGKAFGMSIEDVVEECKLFYFAGQETTSVLLVWTMILLSKYQDWQVRAREEVLQVIGDKTPDFEQLSDLKIVTMILYESLRLYPPLAGTGRRTEKETKLGDIVLPPGVLVSVLAIITHLDSEVWGEDAKEFKPERFKEGVIKATNGKPQAFSPFGGGPRICIGQNFALVEAKVAIAMILQRFSFELSPSYTHAPSGHVTMQPQYGAPLIMHKL